MASNDVKKTKSCPSSSRKISESLSTSLPLNSCYHYESRSRSKSVSALNKISYEVTEISRLKERLLRTNSRVEPLTIRKFTREQKMTLMNIALVDFMSFCSMSIMAPFFPKEATEKGMTDTMSGFVFSFYALIMFLISPIFGKILPAVGGRFLFLSGIFVTGTCNILFGMLEIIEDYKMFTLFCFILRGFAALGASAFSTASFVFVINSFPNNIGAVLGLLETFVGLGMSTGPAIGGLLYSLGGFELPFFVLGIVMLLTLPINIYLLPKINETNTSHKPSSITTLLKVPTVIAIGFVVVVMSTIWSFLDPTLEPHLRQFNLSPGNIGLIFLLFSSLYGIFSPLWGCLADKLDNNWTMMVWGSVLSSIALMLLGPCPYIPYLSSSIWLNLVSLALLGISVALALLPTFQGVLISAIESGCEDSLPTYGIVAGIWSCMYSLGEVIGPSIGGFLLEHYGFPITATILACATFFMAMVTLLYFLCKSRSRNQQNNASDSGILSFSNYNSYSEDSPLLNSMESSYRQL